MNTFVGVLSSGVVAIIVAVAAPGHAQPAAPPDSHHVQPPASSAVTAAPLADPGKTDGVPAKDGMPMMDMCRQMMGDMAGMPMMGSAAPAAPKEKADMLQMRGEMMKMMGELMMKHAQRMQGTVTK